MEGDAKVESEPLLWNFQVSQKPRINTLLPIFCLCFQLSCVCGFLFRRHSQPSARGTIRGANSASTI